MADKDIECKVKSAFEKIVPDVLDSVLEECSEQKGQLIKMTDKKRIHVLRIAVIAAVVAAVMTVSVGAAAAVTFSGLTDKNTAFGSAATYIVKHAENDTERNNLANFILSGMTYDISSEDSEVDLGLSGFRAVYNVKFKVGGYAYQVKVDAKTGVVLDCEKEIDEGWEEYLQTELGDGITVGERVTAMQNWNPEIDAQDAMLIAQDYLGFTGAFESCVVDGGASASPNYEDDIPSYSVVMTHGGYQYTVNIDSITGDFLSCDTVEDEYGADDRHLHKLSEAKYIGRYKAKLIAKEKFLSGNEMFTEDDLLFIIQLNLVEGYGGYNVSGHDMSHLTEDFYNVYVQPKNQSMRVLVFIDAKTGEIVDQIVENNDPTTAPNQDASTDAPDGLISEAAAQAIALEDCGVDMMHVHGLKIGLTDGIYDVVFEGGSENGLFLYTYAIDAVSGEIIEAYSLPME